MTLYSKQVQTISSELYSNVYLVRQVIQAKYFIDTSFANKITLADVCEAACISKYHLIRSFKRIYGVTPNQYLTTVRMQAAKALLKSGSSVLETCFAVGFDSSTTFAGLFKKNAGSTPNHFRRKAILER
jgi:AraC-like DNA-binding protein